MHLGYGEDSIGEHKDRCAWCGLWQWYLGHYRVKSVLEGWIGDSVKHMVIGFLWFWGI